MAENIKESVLKRAERDDVKFVNLWFTDFFGSIKSTTITIEKLEESLDKGTWFDGSSIEGFARIHESDMILMPDPSTYAILPWRSREKSTARFICDVHKPNGKPFEGDPRYILKKVMEEARIFKNIRAKRNEMPILPSKAWFNASYPTPKTSGNFKPIIPNRIPPKVVL